MTTRVAALSLVLWLAAGPAQAASLQATRSAAVNWLQHHQSGDGSWGPPGKRWVTTAEALLALVKAGRGSSLAAQRAKSWLLHNESASIDARARAIRALKAAGANVAARATALRDLAEGIAGFGPVAAAGITSYDTSLALGALAAAGVGGVTQARKNTVLSRRRSDQGWSGDGVPVSLDAPSDRIATAEIVRALAGLLTPSEIGPSSNFLTSTPGVGGAAVDSSTPSLELCARLAALHARGVVDPGIEGQLLDNDRLSPNGGVWDASDALVNAVGLLALATKPGVPPPSCADDSDGDDVDDCEDAFPDDPEEQADQDGDGEGDNSDLDKDGDGVENGEDPFPDDGLEWADADADGTGDNADLDDDQDGIPDLAEYETGTDSLRVDSDGDRFVDGSDGIVPPGRLAGGWDLDDDDFVDGEADHGSSPLDGEHHPGRPGDVAPLGHPDVRIGVEDLSVLFRILELPEVLDGIPGTPQNRDIAAEALDANGDGKVDAGDAGTVLRTFEP